MDDGVGEDGDDEADDGVEDGVFGVGDFFAVAAGHDVAEAAPDEHDDADNADGVEHEGSDVGENAGGAKEVGGHTVGLDGFGAFLCGVVGGHNATGPKGGDGASSGEDLADLAEDFFHK